MKSINIMFLSVLLIGITFGSISAQTEILVGTDDWPPYEYEITQNGNLTTLGFSTEVVKAVLAKMNLKIKQEIRLYPFSRLENFVLSGTLDAAYSLGKNEKRMQDAHYPEEGIINSEWVVYIRKSDLNIHQFKQLSDLKGKKIGVVQSYAYNKEFWDYIKEHCQTEEVISDEQNMQKLNVGRIHYVAAEYGNAQAVVKKLGLSDQVIALKDLLITKYSLYMIFNKKNVQIERVNEFSATLKAYKSTQEYKDLYQKYFLH